jgi:2,4-dienoyl-CoA reductase-like NADH-dependent reductase (Old Yellow Enzyme family)
MIHAALTPLTLGPLELRNRVVKAATNEGMAPAGRPSQQLVAFHEAMAENGVGLTTVAYGAVASAGRTFADQLLLDDAALPVLRELTDAVHGHGGAAMIQLTHCGGFSKNTLEPAPRGPSSGFNNYGSLVGRPWIRAMTEADIEGVIRDFGEGARRARDAGFDAVEVHVGHGYLLSQFLSPAFNRRRDGWGGDRAGRLRLPRAVVEAVRAAVPELAVIVKLNLDDGIRGGITLDDAVLAAQALEESGADGIIPSGGLVQRTPFFLLRGDVPLAGMVAAEDKWMMKAALRLFAPFVLDRYEWSEAFFVEGARRVRDAVGIPVGLLGGVSRASTMQGALDEGFGFVVLGRALLSDPDLVGRIEGGEDFVARCTHCNQCVAAMDDGGVRCVL